MPPIKSTHQRSEAKRRHRNKPRAPVVKAEPDPLAGIVTDEQEIALAIWLWKSLRCHGALRKPPPASAADAPSWESVRLGEKAIELAKRCGVKREFFDLLFDLKLVAVSVKAME